MGAFSVVGYMGRLHPKEVPFLGLQQGLTIYKRVGQFAVLGCSRAIKIHFKWKEIAAYSKCQKMFPKF